MNNPTDIPEVDGAIPTNAVSIYGSGDAMDDFPVLKAFQQYIDAEQSKARKRMVLLGIFFGSLTLVIIAVFMILLVLVNRRNQELNDRLVEFAMSDRNRAAAAPVVVQPNQDSTALLQLNSKLEEMQRKLLEREAEVKRQTDEAVKKAAITPRAANGFGQSKEELEIERLKLQVAKEKEALALQKEQLALEKAKQKELELEAYRRKHYPELYESTRKSPSRKAVRKPIVIDEDEDLEEDIEEDNEEGRDKLDEVLKELDDSEAVSYFDDDEADEEETVKPRAKTKPQKSKTKKAPSPSYSIPVEVKGANGTWSIPED